MNPKKHLNKPKDARLFLKEINGKIGSTIITAILEKIIDDKD